MNSLNEIFSDWLWIENGEFGLNLRRDKKLDFQLSHKQPPQLGFNKDHFAYDIERAHPGNYKNPNSPIHAKLLSWRVAQGILESIIKANMLAFQRRIYSVEYLWCSIFFLQNLSVRFNPGGNTGK